MLFFYNIGIRLYFAVIWIASFFNDKAGLWIEGRKGWQEKMKQDLEGVGQIIWIHCASLGEFEQGRPLIEKLKSQHNNARILLTFFSPSGYEVRKNYQKADFIYYLPLDTKENARKFLQIAKPECAIFIKYEFWYHFLHEAKNFGTELVLISAIFRPGQLFFKPWGGWYRKMLTFYRQIFVQDQLSASLLAKYPSLPVSIAGDTRFDRVYEIAGEARNIPVAEKFSEGRFTFVLGSTWPKDEALLTEYILSDPSDACYILAPHEIGAAHLLQITDKLGDKALLFSKSSLEKVRDFKVLIIDNIGMLSSLYRYGQVAYIGGGFGRGIHNVLEPAVYGIPVLFGPRHEKFLEAVMLVRSGGAFPINSYGELKEKFDSLQKDKQALNTVSMATSEFIQKNLGATQTILSFLTKA
ncbi:MAG: 3-deoxy-D-manno-octulosonic acid transferase [Bacteroidales bacterium]|nr:3-deoxy-D-manno-octulosonic acid transferase [Bacteroidales bacterium]